MGIPDRDIHFDAEVTGKSMDFYVLGDEDVILGFQFAGIKGSTVSGPEEASAEFESIVGSAYGEIGVLLISEKTASMIEDKVLSWQMTGNYPLIVEIPDLSGRVEGKKSMLDSIREAIGIHI